MELSNDVRWMDEALRFAREAMSISSPNPRVGCVIVSAEGHVLGAGSTQPAGQAHAEVMALREAQSRGVSVVGATAYVTLEPCAHFGRTGPCCDALIRAGIGRVVAAVSDPNPLVAGQGFSRLRAAGVEVVVGLRAAEARELNIGFFSRMVRQRPWVRLKIAASLNGVSALDNGLSQWITSEAARSDGHAWRARACAILSGVGTVLADDPRLTVRLPGSGRQPHVVVLDSRLRTPSSAKLFATGREHYIYTSPADVGDSRRKLEERGATVIPSPRAEHGLDLQAVLSDLARRGVNELHVEAGRSVNGGFIQSGLADELLVYLAPTLLGSGYGMADLGVMDSLTQGKALQFRSIDCLGPDLRIVARIAGSDDF